MLSFNHIYIHTVYTITRKYDVLRFIKCTYYIFIDICWLVCMY